ncbi:glycerol-3-phosphate 1-O-acyltransferase PlsY [Anaerolentibacter hominis]|uniref:glycerol-3-phosphate 1-O-acyltransferase PlsY n=1 Tax=Anaerolentibacter hominis TaxID=3079009 RepID=UPI0031B87B47
MILFYCLAVIIGYGFGCISTGYFLGKHEHIDIRTQGSGNIGTTNALRTLGIKGGVITLVGDMGKAVLAVLLVRYIGRNSGIYTPLLTLVTGLGVILGHNFPFWLHFKGGKGIAATAGLLLIFDWRVFVIAAVAFLIPVIITRYVSVGSLVFTTVLPIGIILFYRQAPEFPYMLGLGIALLVLAFIRHRSNLKRLAAGTENKLGEKKK